MRVTAVSGFLIGASECVRTGQRIGELEMALDILRQEEALHQELGDKDGLQISYANQAVILRTWGRLKKAMVLLE